MAEGKNSPIQTSDRSESHRAEWVAEDKYNKTSLAYFAWFYDTPLDFVIEHVSMLWSWPPFIGTLLRLVWTAHSAPTPLASIRKKSISSQLHCFEATLSFTHSVTRNNKQQRSSYTNSDWSFLFLDFLFENLVISQLFKSHWTNLYPFFLLYPF